MRCVEGCGSSVSSEEGRETGLDADEASIQSSGAEQDYRYPA